jgi:hypothetical protein
MRDTSPKVVASTVGCAATVCILYVASLIGVEMDETVAVAIVTLVVFLAGYFTTDPLRSRKR